MKKVRVGLDFDGVVAYNPFRVIRAPIAIFKRHILGIKQLRFWYPKKRWQQIFWIILHESSVFPAKGADLLKELVKEKKIEAHLITARYSFLDDHLYNWLDKYKLRKYFKTVNINKKDEQPHLFKEKVIKRLNLDVHVEDNWDIVNYLSRCLDNSSSKLKIQSSKLIGRKQFNNETMKQLNNVKIYWIYNVVDRFRKYKYKFPYLEKALEDIVKLLNG